jgi:hypothetical protein
MRASMNSTSPPVGVNASPVATPTSSCRSTTSDWKRGGPSNSATCRVETLIDTASPITIALAALRLTVAISRSRLRTPASRVYSRIIRRSADGEIFNWPGASPFSVNWRGSR